MVSPTEDFRDRVRPSRSTAHFMCRVLLGCLTLVALLAVAGCSTSKPAPSGPVGAHMGGAADAGTVVVTRAALESTPQPAVLSTPESAARSYLDWISYAYRIGDSRVATATMTPAEGVRVDAYIQLNLEKTQFIDQTLLSATFGKASIEGTHATLPAKENWTYRYVSSKSAGATVTGPFSVSYDVTYTVVKSGAGWVVDSTDAKSLEAVK